MQSVFKSEPGRAAIVACYEQVEEFMALAGRHFRPLLEPAPVFSDDEVRLLLHAEVHLLEESGHAIVGQSEAILRFLTQPLARSVSSRARAATA